ncbi:hypothetical protein TSUD_177230 [Trifolium subterraneum]|uniref:DUF674 family protein n=1 Tax=Trifolium subterraneum TaxID=3900 RepID=A0A2Z6NZS6_TRISU|nr:hypothetical protein TSUD_177230 [Trifolium subterraneum]
MATTQTVDYVPLKLVVDEESNKVIFAEAGKDFVDILCSFLTFPLGTIIRLVQKESNTGPVTIGCLNNLYQSVADLEKDCMKTETTKEMLLQPSYSLEDYCSDLKLNIDDSQPTIYYICKDFNGCYNSYVLSTSSVCDGCGTHLDPAVSLDKQFCNGFVNGGATFVITDDLRVIPNSMDFTSFRMLRSSGIKNITLVKEIAINVTKQKVLNLLKCSLVSKSTLTDSFLRTKPTPDKSSRIFAYNAENTNDIQITMKLVLRKSDGKILYAQADHDFADLILSFLTFPLGGVVNKQAVYLRGIGEGYVKGPRTYVVTDNLVVTQSSPTSALHLINYFQTSLDNLKEKVINIGVNEVFSILKASLTSTSTLTDGLGHLET